MIDAKIQALDGQLAWADSVPDFSAVVAEGSLWLSVALAGRELLHDFYLTPDAAGRVTVALADMLDEECRRLAAGVQKLVITATGRPTAGSQPVAEQVTIHLLHRTRSFATQASEFAATHFMTLSERLWLRPGDRMLLPMLILPGEGMTFTRRTFYRAPDGSIGDTGEVVTDRYVPTSDYVGTYPLYADLRLQTVPAGCVPLLTTVRAGRRRIDIYALPEGNAQFSYRNELGFTEWLCCTASVSRKNSVKASLTMIRRRLRDYDRQSTVEHTVQFGPMGPVETARLEALAESAATTWKELRDDGSWSAAQTIRIASAELTADPDPDSPVCPKITFRLASPVRPWEWPEISGRIHAPQFSEPYD